MSRMKRMRAMGELEDETAYLYDNDDDVSGHF